MLATILSCSVPEKLTDSNYHLIKTPPNGVRVADNFFCDKTEMTNIDWLEYMFWTKRIFGGNSPYKGLDESIIVSSFSKLNELS